MKLKILTSLAALTLLIGAVSTHAEDRGPGYGGYQGHEYGYSNYGYPPYGYAPSTVGPAYVDSPWGYGFDTYGFDDDPDYDLPPPAPNPDGAPKTIEIPQDKSK
jgi:hypothetical protein